MLSDARFSAAGGEWAVSEHLHLAASGFVVVAGSEAAEFDFFDVADYRQSRCLHAHALVSADPVCFCCCNFDFYCLAVAGSGSAPPSPCHRRPHAKNSLGRAESHQADLFVEAADGLCLFFEEENMRNAN